ncbi:protein PLASTID MOVEMENT IMPAIRED 1-RELATED 2 [Euphorbia lathyris]|uniref:protein PLASTID MOVEMENT IMPAIRED 1-RELATED 2 n=1 Tax=Euphorbia lathyris TaxID=212925 RepID=UPI00331379D5
MMLPKIGSANSDGDVNSNSGQLLRDIEAISKALYLQKAPTVRSKSVEKPRLSESKSSLNLRNVDASVSYKDKKSTSIWNWTKPLKALAHIRHQKFNICFFLHVHSIEGLPPGFNEMHLSVHWKRKDEVLQTCASKVENGTAEFDETLVHKCSVYGSKSGPLHSAKYEVKLFLIYVSVVGAPVVDTGNQWIDLTRLLPVTLEELEGQKSTGKWTTSFRLAGKAKGATLNVTLGFSIIRDNLIEPRRNMYVPELVNVVRNQPCTVEQRTGFGPRNNNGSLQRVGSVPSSLNGRCRSNHAPSQAIDVKICDEFSPNMGLELSKSINFLYQKLNEVNLHSSEQLHILSEHVQPLKLMPGLEFEPEKDIAEHDSDSIEFTVTEQGTEFSNKELDLKVCDVQSIDGSEIETIDVDEIFEDDDGKSKFHSEDNILENCVNAVLVDDHKLKGSSVGKTGSSREDLEFAFNSFMTSESAKLEFPFTLSEFLEQESCVETESNYSEGKEIKRSLSLDELTESVATDFLNMLGLEDSPYHGLTSDGVPESPRERLLREFEEEAMTSCGFIIDYDADGKSEEFSDVTPAASGCEDPSKDFNFPIAMQVAGEDHERASQLLSRRRKAKMLEDLETEDLMKQWGLNEDAFQSSPRYCSDGFGSPVELFPEERVELPRLGDGFGHLVQIKNGGHLRSMDPSLFRNSKNVGNLVMQVSGPVVLPAELGSDIIEILQHLASIGIKRLSMQVNKLMPLEDITGKTLQQIAHDDAHGAALPVRQTPLRRQLLFEQDIILDAEMESDNVTLEKLHLLVMEKIEAMSIEGLRIQSGMSEVAPSSVGSQPIGKMLALETCTDLQALDAGDCSNDVERLLELTITLDEWLSLDTGVIGNNRAVEVLAAHHAKSMDFIDWDDASGRRHGLLGDNLTVAVMMLLRDPLRNYEPVGASMLALVQVQRSFFHVEPTMLQKGRNEDDGDINGKLFMDEMEDEYSFGFKIKEVHLSGLNDEPGKTKHWGTKTQQQYGTRWLLASGLSKSSRHPISKSRAIVLSQLPFMRMVQNNDFLWSISSHDNVTECGWKELDGFVPHVRNPNVIFPNEK